MADGGEEGMMIIFVYMGRGQVVPADVTHVIIHKSVKIIPSRAFYQRSQVVGVCGDA